MKRILEYLAFSIVLAGVLSAFTTINVSNDVLNTIYTVAGVIFSVGMSIAIMPKTDKVTKDKIRAAIRASYLAVRNSFMYLFGIETILFVVAQAWVIKKFPTGLNLLCAIFILISIIHYIYNFVRLQKLGEEIEDQVLKETERK